MSNVTRRSVCAGALESNGAQERPPGDVMTDRTETRARVLDGKAAAARIQETLRPRVERFTRAAGRPPGLGIVLAGDDPASAVYVGKKVELGKAFGLRVDLERLPADAGVEAVLAIVARLNASPDHDGILVQSPLPPGMGGDAERRVVDTIEPAKDADGLTAVSVGRLVQKRPGLVSCTPAGVIRMLEDEGIDIAGRHAVVVGRSDIVGKPMAMLLLHRDATVTLAHSRTPDLAEVCRRADLLVTAVGRPGLIRAGHVRPGAVVIDVGVNRVTDPAVAASLFREGHRRLGVFRRTGSILVGDVHPEVEGVAGALTPVPGGVGPLTVTMLMANTLQAAEAARGGG
jgi:methylenetetrahydrofolate dehydrogenase (NADP+)/methenyltetrahydrofolate cyclohydrolase